MKRIVAVLAGLLVVSGCGQQTDAETFRSGLPTQEMVKLQAPEGAGQALTEGAQSEFYLQTLVATRFVNGSTVAILGLLKWVTDHRPTSIEAHKAIWGPYEGNSGDGLRADNDWKLTVERVGDHTFNYALEAKGASDADDAWVIVLSGHHVRAVDANGEPVENFGEGGFLIDWDAAKTLPKNDGNVGTAEFAYSRTAADAPVSVTVAADDVRKDIFSTDTVDGRYAYTYNPGEGGTFDFKVAHDLAESANDETFSIRSRWLQTGAGRSDVTVTGGIFTDMDPTPVINECWNTSYNSVFQYRSYDSSEQYNYGTVESCAFTEAEYSNL